MNHRPRRLDVATDLIRCIYASLSEDGFESENLSTFFSQALKKLNLVKKTLDPQTFKFVKERIDKSKDKNLPAKKRREELLSAAISLQN